MVIIDKQPELRLTRHALIKYFLEYLSWVFTFANEIFPSLPFSLPVYYIYKINLGAFIILGCVHMYIYVYVRTQSPFGFIYISVIEIYFL